MCRDVAVRLAEGQEVRDLAVGPELVRELLGPPRHRPDLPDRRMAPGVAVGLGTSPAGGELVLVEVTRMPGTGKVRITGNLGPVASEAAHTAVSFVRSRTDRLHLDPEWIRAIDLHMHIPRARAVQDSASLGVTMFCAVASLLLEAPCRPDVAAVGELTLRGSVLPIRGIKAILLAAHRLGIREVLLPARNEPDLHEVPAEIRDEVRVHLIQRMDEVLPLVLSQPDHEEPPPSRTVPPPGEMRL